MRKFLIFIRKRLYIMCKILTVFTELHIFMLLSLSFKFKSPNCCTFGPYQGIVDICYVLDRKRYFKSSFLFQSSHSKLMIKAVFFSIWFEVVSGAIRYTCKYLFFVTVLTKSYSLDPIIGLYLLVFPCCLFKLFLWRIFGIFLLSLVFQGELFCQARNLFLLLLRTTLLFFQLLFSYMFVLTGLLSPLVLELFFPNGMIIYLESNSLFSNWLLFINFSHSLHVIIPLVSTKIWFSS